MVVAAVCGLSAPETDFQKNIARIIKITKKTILNKVLTTVLRIINPRIATIAKVGKDRI